MVERFPDRTPRETAVMLVDYALSNPRSQQRNLVAALGAIMDATGTDTFLSALVAFSDQLVTK